MILGFVYVGHRDLTSPHIFLNIGELCKERERESARGGILTHTRLALHPQVCHSAALQS